MPGSAESVTPGTFILVGLKLVLESDLYALVYVLTWEESQFCVTHRMEAVSGGSVTLSTQRIGVQLFILLNTSGCAVNNCQVFVCMLCI